MITPKAFWATLLLTSWAVAVGLAESPCGDSAEAVSPHHASHQRTTLASNGEKGVDAFSANRRESAENGPLVPIGAAVVDITPNYPTRLTGYAARGTDAEGVAAAIHARALAIGPADALAAVLISVDNCGIPQSLAERVYGRLAERHAVPRERFAILATHSHSAPWLRGFAPNIIPDLPAASAERLARYEH